MAYMVPDVITNYSTEGEQRVFYFLKDKLPDDYIGWYELDVEDRYPDFVILGPEIGILILEVKDWSVDNITSFNQEYFYLNLNGVRKQFSNPQKQGKNFKDKIANKVKNSLRLQNLYEHIRINNAICFPNITREEYRNLKDYSTGEEASKLIKEEIILFKDDLENINEPDTLRRSLISLLQYKPRQNLSSEVINQVRGALDSNIIVKDSTSPIIKMLEIEQEQIVKRYPLGNTLLRGNAGSGKSVILYKRAKYLYHKFNESSILILCFNKALAAYYRDKIFSDIKGVNDNLNPRICIKHYHEFRNEDNKYDFIFIDEGQDFKFNWYEKIENSLSKNQNSHVFIASDGAQLIYDRKEYSYKDIGIEFDHTITLKDNYRNTSEICSFAEKFLFTDTEITGDLNKSVYDNKYLTKTLKKYRNGKLPVVRKFKSTEEEYEFISSEITKLHKQGVQYAKIGILIFSKKDFSTIKQKFNQFPLNFINQPNSSYKFNDNNVQVAVVNSSKGLEFDYVFLCGFHSNHLNIPREKKKVYVGMTRAVRELNIVYSETNASDITDLIETAYEGFKNENDTEIKLNYYEQLIQDQYEKLQLDKELIERERESIEKDKLDIEKKKEELNMLGTDLANKKVQLEEDRSLLLQKEKELERLMLQTQNEQTNVKEHSKNTPKRKRKFAKIAAVIMIVFAVTTQRDIIISNILKSEYFNQISATAEQEHLIEFDIVSMDDITSTYTYIYIDDEILKIDDQEMKGYYKNGFKMYITHSNNEDYMLNLEGEFKEQSTREYTHINKKIPLNYNKIDFQFSNEAVEVSMNNLSSEKNNINEYVDFKDGKFIITYDLTTHEFINLN